MQELSLKNIKDVARLAFATGVASMAMLAATAAPALADDTGSVAPGTMSNVDYAGTSYSWGTPSNAIASDNTYTTSVSPDSMGTTPHYSDYLTATNFGNAIPGDATIDGIVVSVERLTNSTTVRDVTVQLLKSSAATGSNYAVTGSFWPQNSEQTPSYGGSSDLWGTTWTPAEINDSGFGVQFSTLRNSGAGARNMQVDSIRITVYYTPAPPDINAPTGLTALVAASKTKDSQTLTWGATLDGESNFDAFFICYGESQTDVDNSTGAGCAGSASTWDSSDDSDMSLEATTNTTITGLDSSTTYWYKIFARDTFDNTATVSSVSSKTKSSGGGGGSEEPAVMVATPNGGETLNPGQSYDIFWAFEGDDVYKTVVSLSTNNGSSYTTVAELTSMAGYHTWTVPDYLTSDALIKISLYNESNVLLISDESDATFRINGTMTPPVVAPEEDDDQATVSGMTRIEANGMLPAGITVDALVKMASDNNPNTTDDSTVYYIGMDAKRHPFMSVAAHMSWYTDYSEVQVISATTLASIPLGSPVLVRPGSHWVKIASDPKTYYVDEQYKLRWIKDEATAVMLGGADWNTKIVDVDPSMFAAFTIGADLSAEDLSSTGNWPSASLLREAGPTSTTWYVSGGKRRPMDASAFSANKFQERFVEVGGTAWLTMSTGDAIVAMEDGIFSLQH